MKVKSTNTKFYSTITLVMIMFILAVDIQIGYTYPFDGYDSTGIRRLKRLQMIQVGEISGTPLIAGAQKKLADIRLNLENPKGDSLVALQASDPALQKALNSLFPNLDESYSVTLLDITPGKKIRYAHRAGNQTDSNQVVWVN